MPLYSRRTINLEAIPFSEQIHCVASILCELEKLEEISSIKVLHQVSLCSFDCLQINAPFEDLTPVDLFFNSTNCNKSVDDYISALSYATYAIHCLIIISRVPIWIENDYSVSTCQVETKASDFSCQQAAEDGRVTVELLA